MTATESASLAPQPGGGRPRVLVAEKIGNSGIALLEQHFDVELGVGWSREDLEERIGEYDGILIRSATSWPILPKPRIPSVFSYSSMPENLDRSHAPPVSEACACGTLRASASRRAIVCSAAVITFDCGALATTIPRLVAADTSTLSTPTPARPTARRRLALASISASSLVDERIRMPS